MTAISGFVPVADYQGDVISTGEIGRYESFSLALSWGPGYKRRLLNARLSRIRVSVIRRRGTQKPFSKKPRWCFP